MSNVVCIHGAWHGAWAWEPVAQELERRGHTVHTPTLTGVGEDIANRRADIDLTTHIDQVTDLIIDNDLRDVVLVGHSYGAMVVMPVSGRIGDRLARIVLVDGTVPEDGNALWDEYGEHGIEWLTAHTSDDRYLCAPPAWAFNLDKRRDAELYALVRDRLTAHPRASFEEKTSLADVPAGVDGVLIFCTNPHNFVTAKSADRCQDLGFDIIDLYAGHEPMLTHAGDVARIIDEGRSAAGDRRPAGERRYVPGAETVVGHDHDEDHEQPDCGHVVPSEQHGHGHGHDHGQHHDHDHPDGHGHQH